MDKMPIKLTFWMSWILVLALVFGAIWTLDISNASEETLINETAKKLQQFSWKIEQDGKDISSGGALDPKKKIQITLDFQVPVKGDHEDGSGYNGTDVVAHGDTAQIKIVDNLKIKDIIAGSLERKILPGDEGPNFGDIGSFKVKSEGDDTIVEITFDGNEKIFDGTIKNVKGKCLIEIESLELFEPIPSDVKKIAFLGKDFDLESPGEDNSTPPQQPDPPQEPKITITKDGELDKENHRVKWTVKVSKGNEDLEGFTFFDDLTFSRQVCGKQF